MGLRGNRVLEELRQPFTAVFHQRSHGKMKKFPRLTLKKTNMETQKGAYKNYCPF